MSEPVLETRHMRLVVALVEEGTTARAASRLHLTQSAVSHQLTELERRLGFPLFTRAKRSLVLTEVGSELLAASRQFLTELVRTESSLRERAGQARARVRVSTECYTCYHWLPAALAAYRAAHADIDVRIVLEATRRPVPALLAGDLDIAIAASKSPAQVERVTLFHDELVCVMPASHPLAKKSFVVARDLSSVHLLTYDVPKEELSWLPHPKLGTIVPLSTTRVPLTEAIVELVRAGMGVSVLARWAVAPYLRRAGLVARPLTRGGLRRTWSALYRKNAAPHVKQFVEQIDARQMRRT